MQTNDDSFYKTPQKNSNTQCQHMFPHVSRNIVVDFFCRFGSATSEPVAIEWFCQLALLNFLFWCEMYQFLSSINILAAQSMTYWKLTKTNEMGFVVLFLLIHTMIQSKDLSAQSEYSKVHFHAG